MTKIQKQKKTQKNKKKNTDLTWSSPRLQGSSLHASTRSFIYEKLMIYEPYPSLLCYHHFSVSQLGNLSLDSGDLLFSQLDAKPLLEGLDSLFLGHALLHNLRLPTEVSLQSPLQHHQLSSNRSTLHILDRIRVPAAPQELDRQNSYALEGSALTRVVVDNPKVRFEKLRVGEAIERNPVPVRSVPVLLRPKPFLFALRPPRNLWNGLEDISHLLRAEIVRCNFWD